MARSAWRRRTRCSRGKAHAADNPRECLAGNDRSGTGGLSKLISHVADSIEAILHRPYGCAEQTISSAYPSLLWLQLKKSQKLPASGAG